MKLRSFFYVLAASVLVLLLVGGGGWVWLIARSPLPLLQGNQAAPKAAIFISRQAPVTVSLLVNPDRLEALRQLIAAPGNRRRSRAELNQLKQSLLASTGLDYAQDIQPWLGEEMTLALTTLDIDRQPQNGRQPGWLLVLETRDPARSQAFLQRFWQKQLPAAANPVLEQYQGVELTSSQLDGQNPAGSRTWATAFVGDRFVLLANHPKVLRSAINTVQVPDLGLAEAADYRQALASLQQGRIGLSFFNLPALTTGSTVDPPYDNFAIGWGLNRQGILAETALIPAAGGAAASTPPLLADSLAALQYIPATSPFALSGTALDQLWSQFSTLLAGYEPVASSVSQSLSNFKTHWGLDLPQDIFAWVKGEYAIGLLPHPTRGAGPRPDWVFVADTTEPETVQQAIQHLDAIAEQQGLGVGPIEVAGQKTAAWTELITAPAQSQLQPQGSLAARVVGVHTAVDNYQVLATSLEALDEVLKAPSRSLRDEDNFKRAIAPLSTPNTGYLYLDWPGSRPWLEQWFPVLRAVEVAGQPFFSHLRSLSMSSYGAEAGVLRSEIFLRFT